MGMIGQLGKAALNQVGINFLGRDFMGEERRRKAREAIMAEIANPVYAPGVAPTVGPGGNAATWEYQPPQKLAERGLSLDNPDLAQLVLRSRMAGIDLSPSVGALTAQQPDVAVGPDGTPYNKKSMAGLPERFRNPTNINGWVTDLNKPTNEGQYFPTLPNGMIPDGRGGVTNVTGLTPAMQDQSRAETLGRTEGTMYTVPRPKGGSAMMTGGQYLGGAGAPGAGPGAGLQAQGFGMSQTPDDAEFAKGVAQSEQKRYEGFLAAGQNARGMEGNLRRMTQLLEGVATGRLTPAGKELASVATSFGIKVDPKWGNVEAADAIANKLVLDVMGGSLGAGFSNADRDFARSMGPQTAQTPQGRKQIIDFALKKAQRDQQIANMARQWQQRAGRLDRPDRSGKTFYDYLDAWGEANPLVGRR